MRHLFLILDSQNQVLVKEECKAYSNTLYYTIPELETINGATRQQLAQIVLIKELNLLIDWPNISLTSYQANENYTFHLVRMPTEETMIFSLRDKFTHVSPYRHWVSLTTYSYKAETRLLALIPSVLRAFKLI